jgi:hypothetical protein
MIRKARGYYKFLQHTPVIRYFHNWDQTIAITPVIDSSYFALAHPLWGMMTLFGGMWNLDEKNTSSLT